MKKGWVGGFKFKNCHRVTRKVASMSTVCKYSVYAGILDR